MSCKQKKSRYKSCRNGKNNNNIHIQWLMRLQLLQEDIHKAIEISKLNYYSLVTYKLTHIQKNINFFWVLLKRILKNKKIPFIPPLFHKNEFPTGCKKIAELFNSSFAKQCSLVSNGNYLSTFITQTTSV